MNTYDPKPKPEEEEIFPEPDDWDLDDEIDVDLRGKHPLTGTDFPYVPGDPFF